MRRFRSARGDGPPILAVDIAGEEHPLAHQKEGPRRLLWIDQSFPAQPLKILVVRRKGEPEAEVKAARLNDREYLAHARNGEEVLAKAASIRGGVIRKLTKLVDGETQAFCLVSLVRVALGPDKTQITFKARGVLPFQRDFEFGVLGHAYLGGSCALLWTAPSKW